MKNYFSVFILVLLSCSQNNQEGNVRLENGTYYVSSNPHFASEAVLSDFFKDIEYIWLKDDKEGSEIGEITTIIPTDDFMVVVDDWICNCLQLFDYEGNFIRKIKSYGQGPGQYMDISEVKIKADKIYLMDGALRKFLTFNFNGDLLEERKIPFRAESFSFDPLSDDLYFYLGKREPDLGEIVLTDESFQVKEKFLPFREDKYYGNFRDRSNFWNAGDSTFFLRTGLDTIYLIGNSTIKPYIVFSYGDYGIDHEEFLSKEKELSSKEFLDFRNQNSRFNLTAMGSLNSRWLMGMNAYNDQSFTSMLDLKNKKLNLVQKLIPNDIDEGIDPYRPHLMLNDNRLAISRPGKSLYKFVQEKKSGMTQSEWETYVKGKGRKLVRAAFDAQKSENPVLIVLHPRL